MDNTLSGEEMSYQRNIILMINRALHGDKLPVSGIP